MRQKRLLSGGWLKKCQVGYRSDVCLSDCSSITEYTSDILILAIPFVGVTFALVSELVASEVWHYLEVLLK